MVKVERLPSSPPHPNQAYLPLLAGSTVQVWGKHGDNFFVKNIGLSIMPPISATWKFGFLTEVGAGSLDIARLLNNIENSSNINTREKKDSCKAAAQAMFESGFELSFIAGMLGNIMKEAAAGEFEIYWGGSSQSYMLNLVNNHNYEARFGRASPYKQVFIDNMPQDNLTTVRALVDLKQGLFGLGMVQWTDYSRITTLLDLYKEVNGGGNTITATQVRRAEGLMITRELLNHNIYKSIYPNWKSANSSDLNSQTAAYNAGSDLCLNYEIPANKAVKAVERGNLAKLIYVDITK
ncbi:MAG: phage tail tip lysozyme [Dehalococcoidia bacterium]|nr:phage tail tip lysozyme [Dehalococcoidia bacterium]